MEFQEIMKTLKAALKEGDAKAIAAEAGCTTQTVYNTFKRTDALSMTEMEKKVFTISMEKLQPRIQQAKAFEDEAAQKMNGQWDSLNNNQEETE